MSLLMRERLCTAYAQRCHVALVNSARDAGSYMFLRRSRGGVVVVTFSVASGTSADEWI
jgi:hypothetical protein